MSKLLVFFGPVITSCRPKQWVKNLLVVSALIPAAYQPNFSEVQLLLLLMFCWILASSSVYIMNDFLDLESDKLDQSRNLRPMAAGSLSKRNACVAFGLTLIGSISLASYLGMGTLFIIILYLSLNLLYSLYLKEIPVIEMLVISFGFCLRAVSGGQLLQIYLSDNFLVALIFGSILVVSAKRFAEKQQEKEFLTIGRSVITDYSESFLRFTWTSSAAVLLSTYASWTINHGSYLRTLSLLPFSAGILIYGLDIENTKSRNPEEVLLKDKRILSCIGLCVLLIVAAEKLK